MNWFINQKIRTKLLSGFFLSAFIGGLIGYIGITNIKAIADSDSELYDKMTVPISWMSEISTDVQRIRVTTRDIIFAETPADIEKCAGNIKAYRDSITAYSKKFEERIISDRMKEVWREFKQAQVEYAKHLDDLYILAKANKKIEALGLINGSLKTSDDAEIALIEKIITIKDEDANLKADKNTEMANSASNTMLIFMIIGFIVSMAIGWIIAGTVGNPINKAVAMIKEMSKGHLGGRMNMDTQDEIGIMAATMDQFSDDLQKSVIGTLKRISEGDTAIEIKAKDDKDEISPALIKLVETIRGLISEANLLSKAAVEGKLATRGNAAKFNGGYKEILQGVNDTLDAVIGPLNVAAEYVDRISKGDIPNKITDKYNGDFNEIKNNLNVCIDAVDALVADALVLSKAAIEGKLATRADATKHQGDFRKVVQGVNDTLDSVIGPLNVAAEYVDRISKGDIPNKITDNYNGDFNEIKNNLNGCIDAVNVLVADAGLLAKAGIAGKLATRADESKHRGDFRKIVMGVNETLDAVVGPINTASSYIESIGRGDIPSKITDSYHGDFAKLVESINNCIDGLHGLVETNNVLNKLAKKDFTAKVEGHYEGIFDEVKTSLNFTIDEISGLLSQIIVNSEEIYNGSEQVADASQSLSQGAAESASSLEEISSSMSEISSQTKINAENANQSSLLAHNSKSSSEKGDTEMHALMNAMSEIGESSKSISKIIKVIDEIAFQTNLLALNAAVEAARAGRQGKGFAVVAEEVRNLAARSAKAAKETAELIEDAVKKSGRGSEIAQRTASALNEIQIGSTKVADIVGEIAAASNEQAHGIAQINIGLSQIDKVTQQNTAGAEETAAAAEELSSQSLSMRDLVSAFKLSNTFQRASSNTHKQKKREIGTGQLRQGSKKLLSPNDIIRLDDEEFGKY